MTALRLLPPRTAQPLPALDAAGQRVMEHIGNGDAGHLVVVGGPGSGKTTVAVSAAVSAVNDHGVAPERVLLIAPTRRAAASLRDLVSLALGRPTGTPMVRTAASVGFAILAQQARAADYPPPVLLTGAEQDVMIRELLDGHRRSLGAALDWRAVVPADATQLPGFREELRNLMMRAAEAGKSPEDLEALGRLTGRVEWELAGRFYGEYLDVMSLRMSTADRGERFDPARVVADGAEALEAWESQAPGLPPAWDLVLVDDYQDATAATTALLRAMAAGGARLVLFGNADQAVQGFRGAVPSNVDRASFEPTAGGFGAELIELDGQHRQGPTLAGVTRAVVERIGVLGRGSARRHLVMTSQEDPEAPVTALVARHHYTQSRAIATLLRRQRHGLDSTPVAWSDMVVVARSTSQLRALRSDLLAADIPCETLGDAMALHAEPAVAPLLTMLKIATGQEWTEESAVTVLSSRLVGLDPVAMRRLRRALVREERAAQGLRSSAELLLDAIADPARWASVAGPEAPRAARASVAVERAREVAQQGGTPGAVLWALWECLDVADSWRSAALAGSARDDADLDAVIALMRAAQVFSERLDHASAAQFAEYLEGQDFAADSLAARAQTADVVSFATPASAAGRQWDVVVIAGLEDGVWPNLRLRDTVLGAQYFADLVADRAVAAPMSDAARVSVAHASRAAVLDDETRALAVAVSRARSHLIVTCVEDEETRPSRYLEWIARAAGVKVIAASDIEGVSDLREAVVRLRVEGTKAEGEQRQRYARMLDFLAQRRAAGAHPREWHGVAHVSTEQPFWLDEETVRVSPSKVDVVEACALKWALENSGGTKESSDKQRIGTLIHEIAAEHPQGTFDELAAALEARWHEVGGRGSWPDRVQRNKADQMITRLARYLRERESVAVAVEQPFHVELGRTVLSGIADRVEVSHGRAEVVDLKTGSPISKEAAASHGQMAMYQLAANLHAFDGVEAAAGARLVFLGSGVSPAVREQAPIDNDEQRQRLGDVVEVMTGSGFLATPNPMCEHCPVKRSCPAQPTGRQVSDS